MTKIIGFACAFIVCICSAHVAEATGTMYGVRCHTKAQMEQVMRLWDGGYGVSYDEARYTVNREFNDANACLKGWVMYEEDRAVGTIPTTDFGIFEVRKTTVVAVSDNEWSEHQPAVADFYDVEVSTWFIAVPQYVPFEVRELTT